MKSLIDPYYGLYCHTDFKILPEYFLCVTLFGHLFFNISEKQLKKYFKTTNGHIAVHHEYLHTIQAKSFKTKYFGFYVYYLFYWVKNLFKYGIKNHKAYKNIPFERECYFNENDFNYNETNWKNYINGPEID
ncbi:MAG: protease [Wendovervirus sonii]|uniref:Protease n=1 Tax=phage Lak_Megaphage_Sonny TaxID=3109229 RepID=A0ABZ0Z2E5_9CAUD|nr:MAG: protease [phage Lak_Megaphage_Sonny]